MRRSLLWILLATLALSAAALFIPPQSGENPASARIEATSTSSTAWASPLVANSAPALPPPSGASAPLPLPVALPGTELEPARRDIFATAAPAPAPTPKPQPAPLVGPIYQPPPPPPVAPPMPYRYWGRIQTPEGQAISYLVKGDDRADNLLPVAAGTRLDDGWQVLSMAEDGVTLVYLAGQQRVVIPIASAQLQ